ncbi:GNAT family N-acetyltransferase [Erwinia sp. CPCC 100877]|nr:GNAT family N-acetyltransferase [Erwinia sp. CPCC 100877]
MCEQARYAHTYVAEAYGQIIGTETICPYWNAATESITLSLFGQPEDHCTGIGSLLMNTLAQDEFYVRSQRIEVPASRRAKSFYLRQGLTLKNTSEPEDEHGYIRMEKFPHKAKKRLE